MSSSLVAEIAVYARTYRRALGLSLAAGALVGGSSAALMSLISQRVVTPGLASTRLVWTFVGLVALDVAASLISGQVSLRLQQHTRLDQSLRLCRLILDAPLINVEQAGGHRVLAALTQDVQNVASVFLRFPQLCINLAVVAGCFAYLLWLSAPLFVLLLVMLTIGVVSYLLPERRAKHHLRLAREGWDQLTGHYRALSDGAKELKLHRGRRRAFFHDVLVPSCATLREHNLSGGSIYEILSSWSQMLYFLLMGVTLFALPPSVTRLEHTVLAGYALTVLYLRGPLAAILASAPTWRAATVSLKKLDDLGLSLSASRSMPDAPQQERPWGAVERIDLDGVSHAYASSEGDTSDRFQLGPLTFSIDAGELVFIIGGNGSGKTTFAKVLTGLYVPETGDVAVNGRRITEASRDAYRQLFSAVFTDSFLFASLLGLEGDDLDLRANDHLKELRLSHKVEVRNGNLSTTELSHGQRKRLALMVALLEDRPAYVFDEWAAGQDPPFKDLFYRHFLPELKRRRKAIVVITHDDKYLDVADRIVRLDHGQIDSTPADAVGAAERSRTGRDPALV